MLETMLALKNNDMRKIPGYDPEPVEKLRKLQRTLVRWGRVAALILNYTFRPKSELSFNTVIKIAVNFIDLKSC